MGKATQHRPHQENRRADKKHRFATHHIRQPPIERHADRLGQQIDREDPAKLRKTAEVSNDGGHRGGHNSDFNGRHKHRQHAGD